MLTIESDEDWSNRIYKGTEFEHIGEEVNEMRITRSNKRDRQRALQKTILFWLGHYFGLPGFEYKA